MKTVAVTQMSLRCESPLLMSLITDPPQNETFPEEESPVDLRGMTGLSHRLWEKSIMCGGYTFRMQSVVAMVKQGERQGYLALEAPDTLGVL